MLSGRAASFCKESHIVAGLFSIGLPQPAINKVSPVKRMPLLFSVGSI